MDKRNILNKLVFTTFLTFIILILKIGYVNAASASISVASTGKINSPITITVSGTAAQWNLKLRVDRNYNSI